MIKVGIDTSILQGPSGVRGVGKYTTCLIKALKEFNAIEIKEVEDNNFEAVDLIHYPYFDFFFHTLPLKKTKKTVVTIHDCIPLVLADHYPVGIKGRINFLRQKFSLKNVTAVLTDSESSKKDIIKFLNVPQERITVTYLAADPRYRKTEDRRQKTEIKQKYSLSERFILYVGDVNYNKNLPGLIKAFNLIKDTGINLVLVGKAFKNDQLVEVKELKNITEELKLTEKIKYLGFVPDEDLLLIYNLALVYCMPSFYEGFGIQILEAMACGCPVVTGNVSSLPEIAGKAAVLVDPYEIKMIAEGVEKVIKDGEFKAELIKAGFTLSREFSWQKTAEETIKIYKQVINK